MKKIVIKVGTSTLTQGSQKLSRRYMLSLVQQIAHLQSQGLGLVLVSSGAIATGKEIFGCERREEPQPSKQTFASIGQVKLMQVWSELFSLFDIPVGQVLLTENDFSLDKREVTKETLEGLLRHAILPIINENDTVATRELSVGNNDSLAALVAPLIGADTVILLTDQEGLYTADPRLYPDAVLIPLVCDISEEICALGGGSSTLLGTGGMATKIEAAQVAAQSGIRTIIASSFRPNVLIDLAEGRQIGTLFLEKERGQ